MTVRIAERILTREEDTGGLDATSMSPFRGPGTKETGKRTRKLGTQGLSVGPTIVLRQPQYASLG